MRILYCASEANPFCGSADKDADIQENGFLQGMTNRSSCYDCHYAYPHTKADMTIMDY